MGLWVGAEGHWPSCVRTLPGMLQLVFSLSALRFPTEQLPKFALQGGGNWAVSLTAYSHPQLLHLPSPGYGALDALPQRSLRHRDHRWLLYGTRWVPGPPFSKTNNGMAGGCVSGHLCGRREP